MHKGDIVLIPFPFTDLAGAKVRPAVVLHVSRGEDCIVAFITTRTGKVGTYEYALEPSKANGLKLASIIRLDKLATLQKKAILGALGAMRIADMQKIDSILKKVFSI